MFELLLYMVRFERYGFLSIVMFGESSCAWFTVRLVSCKIKGCNVKFDFAISMSAFTITLAFATMSVILIVYVASRSVIFALERSSFAVI